MPDRVSWETLHATKEIPIESAPQPQPLEEQARWLQKATATSESPLCPPYLTGSLAHGANVLIALKKGGKQVPLF